jgi:phosphoenolpyruvate-protein phosphotransferase (PTS system enzyme I)
MGDRPVVVRTLDLGGDKPPAFLYFEPELNPFLGWRAIRICLDDIPLFKTQLRAILRASVGHRVSVMFPMISDLGELRRARQIFTDVGRDLDSQGLEYSKNIPVGIMIETPAAAVMADVLAAECDFFSLGTNDLTQYTLAVDRTNERVGKLFQPLHPAVLRLVKNVIDASHLHNIRVGMCGELASMKKAIPILLGLGLEEFSMTPGAIPDAKYLISRLSMSDAASIASDALSKTTSLDIDAYMNDVLTRMDD